MGFAALYPSCGLDRLGANERPCHHRSASQNLANHHDAVAWEAGKREAKAGGLAPLARRIGYVWGMAARKKHKAQWYAYVTCACPKHWPIGFAPSPLECPDWSLPPQKIQCKCNKGSLFTPWRTDKRPP
jgi:hypothetical protein